MDTTLTHRTFNLRDRGKGSIFILLASAGLATACSGENDIEIEAVAACETAVKAHLLAADTYETKGMWRFSQSGNTASVRRKYTAANAFGANIDGDYECKYNEATSRVVALKVFSPLGAQTLIRDATDVAGASSLSEDSRLQAVKAGAERSMANDRNSGKRLSSGEKPVRWITNLLMSGCPEASDWFPMQDATRRDDFSVELPSRCFKIQPGTVIITPAEGHRETVSRKGSSFEKATLENGQVFWTDSLDWMSITPL